MLFSADHQLLLYCYNRYNELFNLLQKCSRREVLQNIETVDWLFMTSSRIWLVGSIVSLIYLLDYWSRNLFDEWKPNGILEIRSPSMSLPQRYTVTIQKSYKHVMNNQWMLPNVHFDTYMNMEERWYLDHVYSRWMHSIQYSATHFYIQRQKNVHRPIFPI